MDSNTHTPRTAKFARRALPVFAIAVLTIGLGACQTPRQGDATTTGHKVDTVQAPVGVDLNRPADRIEEQLQREAAQANANAERFHGVPADRIEEQLAREAGKVPGGVSAITLQEQSIAKQLAEAQAKAAPNTGSWTDRITAEIEYRAAHPHLDME